ncbi:N-acetyllactosaminide beta-1,3-N-acetylglucosaminyltransferase 2-like isoform X1 [Nerophis ophidion]|uniref:N-acetyllactosaminide beta-1,3-N-acetylglucosaminyltransferase 2-like isoform X1 n=1 Tax=Nerophis ophidion TaxID=159077 RepID=UPI002AE00067|nr:N-acetyllactosaminide beta-1,3-N-acetylglucosaminyltransferase 2-like isoform X1 [Nerophis ophidion]
MARCYCRWCRVLFCVCSPCICLILLFLYASIMVCIDMKKMTLHSIQSDHYVTSGSFKNKNYISLPKTFWKLHEDAFWNQLQVAIDRHFNPILNPQNTKTRLENTDFYDYLLRLSFSEVTDLESMRKKLDQLPRQLQDFVSNMKRRNYPLIIQPANSTCGAGAADEQEPPLLLLAIKTTELNFKKRHAIRQTWGQAGWVSKKKKNGNVRQEVGGYVRRVFLMGKENPEDLGVDVSKLLEIEGQHYGDIVQWDFSDTFFNLTLKDVLFWSWYLRSCSQIRFVFKGDDDVFVNTPNLITYLHEQLGMPHAEQTMNEFMVGNVIGAASPIRLYHSKYFVPDSLFKGLYPMYAGGGGVVYSGRLVKRLHDISRRVHLFPIDDVFVGMCMSRLNAAPIHHPAFLTFDFTQKEAMDPCAYHKILLVHKRSPTQLIALWDNMSKTKNQCWNVSLRVSDNETTTAKTTKMKLNEYNRK